MLFGVTHCACAKTFDIFYLIPTLCCSCCCCTLLLRKNSNIFKMFSHLSQESSLSTKSEMIKYLLSIRMALMSLTQILFQRYIWMLEKFLVKYDCCGHGQNLASHKWFLVVFYKWWFQMIDVIKWNNYDCRWQIIPTFRSQ